MSRLDIDDCLNTANCTPTVVVGGACGTPADGNATSATFNGLGSMTTDGTTVWIGDQNTIRAYDIASGDVTTVAGQAGSCAAVDDWSRGSANTCAGNAPGGVPQLDTPMGAFSYHFRTRSSFIDGNGLRRLE